MRRTKSTLSREAMSSRTQAGGRRGCYRDGIITGKTELVPEPLPIFLAVMAVFVCYLRQDHPQHYNHPQPSKTAGHICEPNSSWEAVGPHRVALDDLLHGCTPPCYKGRRRISRSPLLCTLFVSPVCLTKGGVSSSQPSGGCRYRSQ